MRSYIIKTERLGLRNWLPSDELPFSEMCQDKAVMEHFPKLLTKEESKDLIDRLNVHFQTYGYTYFAVDILESSEFIGFTGLKNQDWESEFTPCVDIGWRLKKTAWGKGYATEAAKGCIDASFSVFKVKEVLSFTTDTNTPSEKVMQKIGMKMIGTVQHPHILNDPRFKHCVVYKLANKD